MAASLSASAWLRALDDAFAHPWESVSHALEGVTEAEAAWQAPAYIEEAPETGWPLPGTIAWHVAHLAHCKRYYTKIVRARDEAETPDVGARVPAASFADEVAALREAHAAQRTAIAELADGDMQTVVGSERQMPLAEFLAMAIRHDTWHAAQIIVVRRLHRTREA